MIEDTTWAMIRLRFLNVGRLDAQVLAANVIDGLIVDHEGAIGVLQRGMSGQDRVVGLRDGA